MYYPKIQPSLASSRKAGEAVLEPLATPQRMLTGYLTEGLEGAKKGFGGQSYSFEDMLKANPKLAAMYLALEGGVDPMNDIESYNIGWDILADPTNAMGLGAAKSAVKASGTKGMITGAPSNTVPNWYGKMAEDVLPRGVTMKQIDEAVTKGNPLPTTATIEGQSVKLTPDQQYQAYRAYKRYKSGQNVVKGADKALNNPVVDTLLKDVPMMGNVPSTPIPKMIEKARGFTSELAGRKPDEVAMAGRKGMGVANWGLQSGMDALGTLMSPMARATYRDTGIQPSAKDYIEQGLKNGKIQEAMAQPQHVLHSKMLQGGDMATNAPELNNMLTKMSVNATGYQPLNYDIYDKIIGGVTKEYKSPKGRNMKYETPKGVARNLFDTALENWNIDLGAASGRPWKMIVKEPKGNTGNHVMDIARKTRAISAASKVFDANPKGFKSVEALEQALRKELPRREVNGVEKGRKSDKGAKVIGSDANGVYLAGGAVNSTSYTEGGVNVVTYVRLDGMSDSIVSDVYDFLEKNPVGKAFEGSMKHRLFTVTPPITVNVKTIGADAGTPYKVKNNRSGDDITIEELRAMTNLRPTNKTAAKEIAKQGMFTGAIANELTDDKR